MAIPEKKENKKQEAKDLKKYGSVEKEEEMEKSAQMKVLAKKAK